MAYITIPAAADDIVAMDVKGFYAFRRACINRTELERFALKISFAWLASASEAEREADPTGRAACKRAYDDYATSAYDGYSTGVGDGRLYAHVASLYLAVSRDHYTKPDYMVELGGGDIYLARANPAAYKRRKTPCYA